MTAASLAVRFACEVAAVVALAWWGWPVLGILAGIAVILVWGAFVGPKSPRRLPDPYRLGVELAIFALAAAGFHEVGHTALAVVFAAPALATSLLVRVGPEPVA